MPRLDAEPIPPDPSQTQTTEVVSGKWLTVVATVGLIIVIVSMCIALLLPKLNTAWYSLGIQIGSSFLLFSVLFFVERTFVRREVRTVANHILRKLTPDTMEKFAAEAPEDLARMADPKGPVAFAEVWRDAILSGKYQEAWQLSDTNWQLSRIQAWLYNNRERLQLNTRDELDECAAMLMGKEPKWMWRGFVRTEKRQMREAWGPTSREKWGAASKRRCMGPGYEMVIFTPPGTHEEGYLVNEPVGLPVAMRLLMHWTGESWKLAAFGADAPPMPGWPPSWWIVGDPSAEQAELKGQADE